MKYFKKWLSNFECFLRSFNLKNEFKKSLVQNHTITETYLTFVTEDFLFDAYYEKFQYSTSRGIDGRKGTDLKHEAYGSKKSDISWVSEQIKNSSYKFHSYQEVLISKGKDKSPRIISKATIRDSLVIYTIKEYFKKNIRGSITTKANDLIKEVIQNLGDIKNIEEYVFFQTDIENYYGSIDQNILMTKIAEIITTDPHKAEILKLIKNIIENPTIEFGSKKPSENKKNKRGIPQGLSVSNILANLYLLEFDNKINTLRQDSSIGILGYYRYVDDILIICKKSKLNTIRCMFQNEITKYKLQLHPNKTKTVDLSINNESFDFLGYVIAYKNGYISKHLKLSNFTIVPRKNTSNNFLKSILSLFTQYRNNLKEIKKLSNDSTKKSRRNLLNNNFTFRLNISIGGCIANNNRYGFFTYFSKISTPFLAYQVQNLIHRELKNLLDNRYIEHTEYTNFIRLIKKPITCFYSTQNETFFKKNIAINFDDYMSYQQYVNQIGKVVAQSENDYYVSLNKKSPEEFVQKYDNEHYEHLNKEYNNRNFRYKIYFYFAKMKQKNLDILSKDIKGSLPY